jgi:enamine deaminase RidA (YjgF/YER057c/UK114 family)
MRSTHVLAALLFGLVSLTRFGDWAGAEGFPVTRIPAPGGEVVFANPDEREVMYDKLTYSAARRAGDFVFLSGVEAGPFEKGDGTDAKAFEVQLRRAFKAIQASLAATGADFSQVVQLQTFHNCKNRHNFQGDFNAQLDVMLKVKAEFMKPPYSTWTALCIDRHYSAQTVVEIQVTAYAPKARPYGR